MNDSNGTETPYDKAMQRAVIRLEWWLERNGLTPYGFALDNKIDPGQFGKLMKGQRRQMTIELADKIERATKGEIPLKMWVPK